MEEEERSGEKEPPLPLRTRIVCLMLENVRVPFAAMVGGA